MVSKASRWLPVARLMARQIATWHSAMALAWSYGLTVLLGRPLNMITNTLAPVVLVVGIADSIHILRLPRAVHQDWRQKRRAA